jgi:hypothetical protein
MALVIGEGTHHTRTVSPPRSTQSQIHFETVDVMCVQNGKISDHWEVGNMLSLVRQIDGWIPSVER